MAGLGRIGQVLHRVHKTRQWTPLTLSSRSKGYTNKDWQPGPYPETGTVTFNVEPSQQRLVEKVALSRHPWFHSSYLVVLVVMKIDKNSNQRIHVGQRSLWIFVAIFL